MDCIEVVVADVESVSDDDDDAIDNVDVGDIFYCLPPMKRTK